MNEVNIEEKQTIYDIAMSYHSELKCQNYDAKLTGVEESNGTVTIKPRDRQVSIEFIFKESDPDRVIALAQMMMAFAQMVKNNNKKDIDISKKV